VRLTRDQIRSVKPFCDRRLGRHWRFWYRHNPKEPDHDETP
jgi:hypothetical protein